MYKQKQNRRLLPEEHMKNLIISAIFGLTALLLINLLGVYIGIELVVSRLSVLTAVVLGIPGVISMLILNAVL